MVYAYCKEKYRVKRDAKKCKYRSRTGPRCCSTNCAASGNKKDWLIRRRPKARFESTTPVKRAAILKK